MEGAAPASSASAPAPGNRVEAPIVVAANVVSPTDDTTSEGTAASSDAPPGILRRVGGAVGGVGFRIFDNMSFIGEVLVDFFELDKPKYYKEIQEMKKKQAKEARRKRKMQEAAEADEIASFEEGAAAAAPESAATGAAEGAAAALAAAAA
mmetsp:Transcript_57411/g.145582  ORF Transcript_57411/g.145582 Transcript_57411/m.145582 type:complete len:151 (-) Transcript_57411:119-571(-)